MRSASDGAQERLDWLLGANRTYRDLLDDVYGDDIAYGGNARDTICGDIGDDKIWDNSWAEIRMSLGTLAASG